MPIRIQAKWEKNHDAYELSLMVDVLLQKTKQGPDIGLSFGEPP